MLSPPRSASLKPASPGRPDRSTPTGRRVGNRKPPGQPPFWALHPMHRPGRTQGRESRALAPDRVLNPVRRYTVSGEPPGTTAVGSIPPQNSSSDKCLTLHVGTTRFTYRLQVEGLSASFIGVELG